MRHRKSRLTLNRFTSWRKATLIDLSRNLLIHQRIKTTKTKAKAARPVAERLISLGKKDNLTSRRKAFSVLQDHQLVKLLFSEIAPLFKGRNGGYCRILPFDSRRGDGAELVIFELTEKRQKAKRKIKKEEPQSSLKEETPQPAEKPQKKPQAEKKTSKKFLGGIRKIFKKEKDTF